MHPPVASVWHLFDASFCLAPRLISLNHFIHWAGVFTISGEEAFIKFVTSFQAKFTSSARGGLLIP